MENYQMFFPCSSSAAGGGAMGFEFCDGAAYSSGPLLLKPENGRADVPRPLAPNNASEGYVQQQHQQNYEDNPMDNTYLEEPDDGGSEKTLGKKKGPKKAKRPKFAFQTRSQVDILDDGYRWRKYGQKAVKNNKFPRSYYRCTHQGCNVKKQVQRLNGDESVVVTTYEGTHSHLVENSTDNFEHILSQMQIYPLPFN
ncbi:hypothetical protein SAY86_009273 [Trapa natans]|uniref:WRKY domain-containing protein n=1 Tax=Trapa natans TaxID=22666 RepID=A0AAN7L1D4_TRANT|nr:hypothetical protein SAY86_009273 [Trapa natans]